MKRTFSSFAERTPTVVAAVWCICLMLVVSPAWAVIDYNSDLGSQFSASFSGGMPTANPFGASTEWTLRGPNALASDLTGVSGGIPASGQAGWCTGAGGVCDGSPTYSYFQPPWQPGVTVVPGIAGHGPQEVLWTAPANVEEGGVAIRGSLEQMFEQARRMRLSVFKNGSSTPELTVDAMPPIVNGVLLQRVDFGPTNVAVNPGDTLLFRMDGSGAGGTGVPTFSAWNVVLAEAQVVIPEPASFVLCLLGAMAFSGARRRTR